MVLFFKLEILIMKAEVLLNENWMKSQCYHLIYQVRKGKKSDMIYFYHLYDKPKIHNMQKHISCVSDENNVLSLSFFSVPILDLNSSKTILQKLKVKFYS